MLRRFGHDHKVPPAPSTHPLASIPQHGTARPASDTQIARSGTAWWLIV